MLRAKEGALLTFQHHQTCHTCGAFMQQVRYDGETIWRCPWASIHAVPERVDRFELQLHCNWPLGGDRIIGGMSREAVRNV